MWKKILIIIFLCLILIISIGYTLLRSSYVKEKIRKTVEQIAQDQLKREVYIGEITGNLLSGINIAGISIAKYDNLSGGKLLDVKSVSIDYSLIDLIKRKLLIKDIQIIQPRIWIEMDENGKLNLPEIAPSEEKPSKSRFSLILANVAISSGEISIIDKRDFLSLNINDLKVNLTSPTVKEMEYIGELKSQKSNLKFQNINKSISDISSQFEVYGEKIKLSEILLRMENSTFRASGEAGIGEVPYVNLVANSNIDLGDFKDFAPQLNRLNGLISINLQADGKIPGIIGKCSINTSEIFVNDLRISDINASAKFTQDTINLANMSAYLADGKIETSAIVNLTKGILSKYNIALKLDNLNVGKIIKDFNSMEPPISGSLNGNLLVNGTKLQPGFIDADSNIQILNSKARIRQKNGDVRIADLGDINAGLALKGESFALNAGIGKKMQMDMKGSINKSAEIKSVMKINGIDLSELSSIATGSSSIIGTGSINASAEMIISDPAIRKIIKANEIKSAKGPIAGISDLQALIALNFPKLAIPVNNSQETESITSDNKAIEIGSLTGNINVINDEVNINNLAIILDDSRIELNGKAIVDQPISVSVNLKLNELKLKNYSGILGEGLPISGGIINGQLKAKGQIDKLNGDGEISINNLRVSNRDFDPINIPLKIKSNVFQIPEFLISSLDEQIKISCDLSTEGNYNLQIKSSPIDISRLYSDFVKVNNSSSAMKPGGNFYVSISGAGNIRSPSLKGEVKIKDLSYNGENFGDGECKIDVHNEKAFLDIYLLNQTFIAELESGIREPFPFEGNFNLKDINLEPILKLAKADDKADLRLTGNLNVKGSALNPLSSRASGSFQNINLNFDNKYKWTNDSPIEFSFTDQKFNLNTLKMVSEIGRISFRADIDLSRIKEPINIEKQLSDIDISANAVIDELDLSAISDILSIGEPVNGKFKCDMKLEGNLRSPLLEFQLDADNMIYKQLELDSMSGIVSYKDGLLELKNFILNAFNGETKVIATLPIDFDIMNPPKLDDILEKSAYVSINANKLDLELITKIVPDITNSGGNIDNINLVINGKIKDPNIEGLITLNDIYIQVKSLPIKLENFDGKIDLSNKRFEYCDENCKINDVEYVAETNLSWKIEDGVYNAKGQVKIPRSFVSSILDLNDPQKISQNLLSKIKNPDTDLRYPEFQFDLDTQTGNIGNIVKKVLSEKDIDIPLDGRLNGKIHAEGFIYNPEGNFTISPLNLVLNDYRIDNKNPIIISFKDRILNIDSFSLQTISSTTEVDRQPLRGAINIAGKINSNDKTFELNLSGEHIHPKIAEFLLNTELKNEAQAQEIDSVSNQDKLSPLKFLSGDINFGINSRGSLESPIIAIDLSAKDIVIPVISAQDKSDSSASGYAKSAKIDDVTFLADYNNGIFNVEEIKVRTFGNDMIVNGTLPVNISISPYKVEFPEKDINMKLLMNNFTLSFLSNFIEPIKSFEGNADADINLSGRIKDPKLSGYLRMENASSQLILLPQKKTSEDLAQKSSEKTQDSKKIQFLDVKNINLGITMGPDAINIQVAEFRIGEGYYRASGKLNIGSGLQLQSFEINLETNPAVIDPFVSLVGGEIAEKISGNIKAKGSLKGDFRELVGKSTIDILKTISGNMDIVPEGIGINIAGHRITNQRSISAKLSQGRLDLPSFRLVDVTSQSSSATSVSAFGVWKIGGDKSFDATVYIDTGFISDFLGKSGLMKGRLGFKLEAREDEIKCFWPPEEDANLRQTILVENASIDRFEGKIVYKNQNVNIEKIWLSSGENRFNITGNVPFDGKRMLLQVDARLNDLSILSLVNKEIVESSGRGNLGVTITGDINKIMANEEPIQFIGFCSIDDLDANFEQAFIKFEDLSSIIYFNSERTPAIRISSFRGTLNGGSIVLSTTEKTGVNIVWDAEKGYRVGEFSDISVTMKGCTFYQPRVYSFVVDAEDINLRRTYDNPLLTGNILVKEGRYIESLQSLINNLFSTREIGVKAFLDYPILKNLELDLNVQVPGSMKMKNELVDATAEATARVRGSLADPRVNADGSIVEGKFSYLSREFTITRGKFTNESRIDPKYDIAAETEIVNNESTGVAMNQAPNIKVQMEVKGSLNERIINLSAFSSGSAVQQRLDLSQSEIISLLTWGTSDAMFSNAFATSSPLLMEPTKWLVESQAERLLKLQEFQIQIDPRNSKETRLVAAKQLMEQISVTVDVGYTGQQWIGLQREVGKNFAIAGKVSQEGEWGFDLKLKRDFP